MSYYKFARFLVLSCFLAGGLSIAACGDSASDPSGTNPPADETPDGDNQGTGTDDDQMDDGSETGSDGGNQDDGQPDDGSPDGGNQGGTDQGGGGSQSGECNPNQDFYGQIAGAPTDQDIHAGGKPSTEPMTQSAGLDKVIQRLKSAQSTDSSSVGDSGSESGSGGGSDSSSPTTVNLSGSDQIEVQGALVTATYYDTRGNDQFWIQDGNHVALVYLSQSHPEHLPDSSTNIRVGMKVNFTATQLKIYGGKPEVTKLTNFEIASKDNPVPYHDVLGGNASISDASWGELVRVGGKVTSDNGFCGAPNKCYTLTRPNGETMTFRSSAFVSENSGSGGENSGSGSGSSDSGSGSSGSGGSGSEPSYSGGYFIGSCITFVGPLSQFPGAPLSEGIDDPTMQLNETNFTWTFRPESSSGSSSGSGQ